MRTIQRDIDGPLDFELQRPRDAQVSYIADLPDGPAQGLAFLIPGFGADTGSDYAQALRRHVVERHGLAAVSVRYHCHGARPANGAAVTLDPRDGLFLIGLAAANGVELGDPRDVMDVTRRLSAAGVECQLRATLEPARGEYQNFGIVQAMDHLAVLGDLIDQGAEFDRSRILALGSSHGGYIAHMIAKIAPRTLGLVIDNSSYVQPPMEYLGRPTSIEYAETIAPGVTLYCRVRSGWSHDNRQAADFYDRDRDLIRDLGYPPHLAAARAAGGPSATIYRMTNATIDDISPPQTKARQAAAHRATGFDSQLAVIGEAELDGRVFKRLVHGLDASLAGLFDMGVPALQPREGPLDLEAQSVVEYECVDSTYRFTHLAAAPYIRGEVVSRFFED